jgi:hypothetical protein
MDGSHEGWRKILRALYRVSQHGMRVEEGGRGLVGGPGKNGMK